MGVWTDQVSAHYRQVFSPPKVRVVGKRKPGAVPAHDHALHIDGHTDRSYYVYALIGAAMMDSAGVDDTIFDGLTLLDTLGASTHSRGSVYSALRAAGPACGHVVDWAMKSVTSSNVDVAIMRSDKASDILSVWQCAKATVVVDGALDAHLYDLFDRRWLLPKPTAPHVVSAVWQAVTGTTRPASDFDGVDALTRDDVLAFLRWGVDDATAWRRLRALLDRNKGGDDNTTVSDDASGWLDSLLVPDDPDPVPIGVPARQIVQKLSQMPGFGQQARDWGMTLASDLRDYAAGRIAWSDVDCGALLVGPPGCGKTTFAKAVALEADVQFLCTSYGDWEGSGSGSVYVVREMKKTFDSWRKAAKNGPIIAFMDELDSLGARGANGHNDSYWGAIINAFLAFADGAEPRDGIVLIGATNFLDRIDVALRRPGRFDRVIELAAPDIATLQGLIHHHLGVDDIHAARACRGMSPADIAQACRDARRTARRSHRDVTATDLIAVVDGMRPKRSGPDDWRVCVHEAGHALMAIALGFDLISVDADRCETAYRSRDNETAADIRNRIARALGGRAAEDVCLDSVSAGAVADLAQASEAARMMVAAFGMGNSLMSSQPDLRHEAEAKAIVDAAYAEAKRIVSDRKMDLTRIATALQTARYLDGSDVAKALDMDPRAELLALVAEDR